ncbi:MAG: SRPBCC family protein [Candidatus Kapabacteria bacterium]|nr:SRPBCC family protein [Ignavibacteriota bacterium]MCW5884220.1 SRPBCC family protein [Candidatus Kapabacteria bacterium]
MSIFRLYKKQFIPISVQEAWEFLSNPKNLKDITPPDMGFEVTSELPPKMYAGMIITYKVRPMLGIPVSWVTEITHVNEPYNFVDEQRFGPYSFWHHSHFIKPVDGGVEMEDIVYYKLPFGFLGKLVEPFLVKPRLKQIFNYRWKVLEQRFPTK